MERKDEIYIVPREGVKGKEESSGSFDVPEADDTAQGMVSALVFEEPQDAVVVSLELAQPLNATRVAGEDGMLRSVARQVQGRSDVPKVLEGIAIGIDVLDREDEGVWRRERGR